MTTPALLDEILHSNGPSGSEQNPAKIWREHAAKFAAVRSDVIGNSFATVPAAGSGPRILLSGHIDEIGLRITQIDKEGFLWFNSVGGWDAQILVGQRVRIMTRDGLVTGVVGRKPTHLLEGDQRKQAVELKGLHIDIGASSQERAAERVRIGDVAVIDSDPVLLDEHRLAARAMDNRLGAYIVLEAARLIAEAGGAPGEVIAVASAQEEVGLHGARVAPWVVDPQAAIAVDVTHATDAPGIETRQLGEHALGSGAVITRSTITHPQLFEHLYATAEQKQIAFTVAAGGGGGTDADMIHLQQRGIATGLVSIPLRYMHSPVELCDLRDVEACVQLIAAACLALEQTEFER